jgi:hypothetical protein
MTAEARLTALIAEAHDRARQDRCTDCTTTTVCGAHYTPEIEAAGWDAAAEELEAASVGARPRVCTWHEGDPVMDVPDDYNGPCIHCHQPRDAHGVA